MTPKSAAIYARVSTDKQNSELQLAELRAYAEKRGWVLYREYIDNGYSGGNTKRPAFIQMLEDARKRRFDLLLVWKLDRLSRSLQDLINTLAELGSLRIDFVSFNDSGLDTSGPTGKLLFHVLAAFGEFERDIIRERVKAGLENARRKGKRLGRPPASDEVFERVAIMRREGLSIRKIAKEVGLDESTIRKRLKGEAEKNELLG